MKFTTFDADNDGWSGGNCAADYKGGWWYNACTYTNPTGLYLEGGVINVRGITWWYAKNSWYSYKYMRFTLIPSDD